MSSEIRDFIPGVCATGPAEPVFAELDKGTHNERLAVLAQEACRSCLQLPHCEQQRAGIAEELGARGVARAVVGAVEVETPQLTADEHAPPKDTSFTFDLQYPLTEPNHVLRVAQQGFRSLQLRLPGAMPTHFKSLAAYLEEHLSANDGEVRFKDANELRQVACAVSLIMLRYRPVQRGSLSRRKRLAPLSDEEKLFATELQDVFIEDVLALREEGFVMPIKLAQVHHPTFYKRVMEAFSDSYHITPGRIRSIIRANPIDPVPPIQAFIEERRSQKQASVSTPPETSGSDKFSYGAYTRHAPELRTYIKAIRSKSDQPQDDARALFNRHSQLRAAHEDVGLTALAYISSRCADIPTANAMLARFKPVLADLRARHGDKPDDISDSQLEQFAYTCLESAPEAVNQYFVRLAGLRDQFTAMRIKPSNYFLRQQAEVKHPLTSEELKRAHEKHRLQSDRKTWRSLDGWMLEKIVELYEPHEAEKVLQYMSLFLKRGYLTVARADSRNGRPDTPYNVVDPKRGNYITLTEDFSYFSQTEQEAILVSFGLDRIVLGYDVDQERLCALFCTPNIEKVVDDLLLPYTRHIEIDRENPQSPQHILDAIRTLQRDDPRLAMITNAKLQAAVSKKLTILLSQFELEPATDHDFSSPACIDGIRLMLRKVRIAFPSIFSRAPLLRQVIEAYLEDARNIKELGCTYPYKIALGYSATVCRNLFIASGHEEGSPSVYELSEILNRTRTRQGGVLLRRHQQLVTQFLPQFKTRKIARTWFSAVCLNNPDEVGARLTLYDQVVKAFNTKWISQGVNHYCFGDMTPDPIRDIKAWLQATAAVDPVRRHILGVPLIRTLALRKRGDELTKALDDRIELFHTLSAEYAESPNPAIDDDIIKKLLSSPGSIRKQLAAQIQRWDAVHADPDMAEKIANIDFAVRRQLIELYRKKPEDGIKAYLYLQTIYEGDEYIEPSMIDEAMKWSVFQAAGSIKYLRILLKKVGAKKYSFDTANEEGVGSVENVTRDSNVPSPEEAAMSSLIDPDEPRTREQNQLLMLFNNLTSKECAAVAAVHQVPWLLPQDMQDDGWTDPIKVCAAFGVRDFSELEPIVEAILAKLRS